MRALKRRVEGDWIAGLFSLAFYALLRVVHRARWCGLETLPAGWDELADDARATGRTPPRLIIAANHAAGIDPLLIQCVMRRKIRWFMEEAQMAWGFGWAWRRLRMIPVRFDSRDSAGLREALRHLKGGGVLGIFPEGGIAHPARRVFRFQPGLATLAVRTNSPVLLFWIHGTPDTDYPWLSLVIPSRTRTEVVGWFEPLAGESANEFDARLRQALGARSGWPLLNEPLPHLSKGPTTTLGAE